jgi:23S rRNA (cytidine1920-2'-O)/16S rRNA (cytidine1409-2'-O)-methyltransferase
MPPRPVPKQRLDELLVARGLAESRARAQALIRAGAVFVAGQRHDKPGQRYGVDAELEVRAAPPYVSRGGTKLAAALEAFAIEPEGRVCLDVGASTGGFTDVLVQRGARRVYAVDVGRGQLAWRLRQEPRVTSLERTDIRRLGALEPPPDLATVDVAFISLRLVLPAVARRVAPAADVVALVKPQFEAGREGVGRGGVVRDPAVHEAVLSRLRTWARDEGWLLLGELASPIAGADGNREWFFHLRAPGPAGAGALQAAAPPRPAR